MPRAQLLPCLLSATAAGFLGWMAHGWLSSDGVNKEAAETPGPSEARAASQKTGAPRQAGGITTTVAAQGSHGAAVRAALAEKDPVRRTAQYMALLAATTPENWKELDKAWEDFKRSGRAYLDLEPMTLRTLGGTLGAESFDFLLKRFGSRWMDWMGPMMEGAVASDPAGSRKWFDAHTDETWRENAVTPFLCAMAKADPRQATRMLDGLDPEFQLKAAGRVAEAVSGEGGAEGTLAWLRQLAEKPTPWMARAYQQSISSLAYAGSAAPEAARVVEALADGPCWSEESAAMVAGRSVWSRATETYDWIERLAKRPGGVSPQGRRRMLASALNQTLKHDFADVGRWSATHLTGEEREFAKTTLLARTDESQAKLRVELEGIFAGVAIK
jgi:hypothetical protein